MRRVPHDASPAHRRLPRALAARPAAARHGLASTATSTQLNYTRVTMPGMTTHAGHVAADPHLDYAALGASYLVAADVHGNAANDHRQADEHSLAGKRREQERLCLKRAEILAGLAQAQHLGDIADSLNRLALSQ